MSNNIVIPVTSAPVTTNYQVNSQTAGQSLQQNEQSNLQQQKINPTNDTQNTGLSAQNNDSDNSASQNRLDVIQQLLAQRYTYPLGEDYRITIYRDNTGQYITMATSLKDGKVTYTPEQSLLSQFPELAKASKNGLSTQA